MNIHCYFDFDVHLGTCFLIHPTWFVMFVGWIRGIIIKLGYSARSCHLKMDVFHLLDGYSKPGKIGVQRWNVLMYPIQRHVLLGFVNYQCWVENTYKSHTVNGSIAIKHNHHDRTWRVWTVSTCLNYFIIIHPKEGPTCFSMGFPCVTPWHLGYYSGYQGFLDSIHAAVCHLFGSHHRKHGSCAWWASLVRARSQFGNRVEWHARLQLLRLVVSTCEKTRCVLFVHQKLARWSPSFHLHTQTCIIYTCIWY